MMIAAASKALETRLAELLMSSLAPCDLGDGIEVVHDVEAVEIEMECDVDDGASVESASAPVPVEDLDTTIEVAFDSLWGPGEPDEPDADLANTVTFAREPSEDDPGTHEFVRDSAPYERIEVQLDANAFLRATIEDARTALRAQGTPALSTDKRAPGSPRPSRTRSTAEGRSRGSSC